jgi:hypothetical protein
MVIDRQGDPATETAVAELMETGAIKRHTRHVGPLAGAKSG